MGFEGAVYSVLGNKEKGDPGESPFSSRVQRAALHEEVG
jgi:hypothetical protein